MFNLKLRGIVRGLAFLVCLAASTAAVQAAPILCGLRSLPRHPSWHASGLTVDLPPADTQLLPITIDVMFLYTSEAIRGAGREMVLRRALQQSVAEANYLYTNSRVNIAINPVYMGLVDYTETGDIEKDLDLLGSGAGEFAGVEELRNDYKADIVCLITELENLGIGGLAWDIPMLRGNSETAYLAVRRSELGRSLVLAHELGHLMGCVHDREHEGDLTDPFYLARRPYIFGNRQEIEGVTYIDVMAYEPGVSLPYFSNPRLDLDGSPLGIPEGEKNPSDTARTINETAPYVAAYRQALSRIEFEKGELKAIQSDKSVVLRLERTGDLSGATSVQVIVSPSSTARPGIDYNLPASTTVDFGEGQAEASTTVDLLESPEAGSRTLNLRLSGPASLHGIGLTGEMKILIRERPPVVQLDSVTAREQTPDLEIVPKFLGFFSPELPVLKWRLVAGSAIAGSDFVDDHGELAVRITDGAYQVDPIHIHIIDDAVAELDKSFQLIVEGTIHGHINYGAVTNEIRLLDDDRPGALVDAPGAALKPDAGLNVAVRHDRKLLVWGSFSNLNSVARSGLALLNVDGSVDESFHPPELLASHRRFDHAPNAAIGSVQMLPQGKFLIAGEFARADGMARSTLARLNPDGSLDASFGENLTFDGAVDAVAIQADGKILVGGAFEHINGQRRAYIARLNADGTVDESFAPNGGPSSSWTVFVLTIALQQDGKILIGGYFEQVDGVACSNLARLNSDGTFDASFRANDVSGPVRQVTLAVDGKIIVAGLFDTIAGREIRKIARLNPDGAIDESFHPPSPNADVSNVISLPDRRLLLNGTFTRVGRKDPRFVVLLREDGTIDPTFDLGLGPDDRLGNLSLHADGSLYLAGRLQSLDGLPAGNIARVKFGPVSSAIVRSGLIPNRDFTLRTSVFPGGEYVVERSSDLKHWAEVRTFTAEGFGREASVSVPLALPSGFLRLRNP